MLKLWLMIKTEQNLHAGTALESALAFDVYFSNSDLGSHILLFWLNNGTIFSLVLVIHWENVQSQ